MLAWLAVVGLLLRPLAGRAGCDSEIGERQLSVRMDIVGQLLRAQRRESPVTTRRGPDRRRVLELLARNRDGLTESVLAAYGVSVPDMVAVVRAGLASVSRERIVKGPETIEVATMRITEAGRRILGRGRL
jgi:hypothetical protein